MFVRIVIIPALLVAGIFLCSCENPATSISEYADVQSMVEDTKTRIEEITLDELTAKFDNEEMFTLIDVRTKAEHDAGYIPGSVLIPRGVLEFSIEKESFWEEEGMYTPLKDDVLVVYCRSGNRSALAAESLNQLGFKTVYSLEGGFNGWKSAFPENIETNLPPAGTSAQPIIAAQEDAGGC